MTTYDPRQDDPMHDDKITQQEFEQAATLARFPTVTIADPVAVGKWLDQQEPADCSHFVSYLRGKFFTIHHLPGTAMIEAYGFTPDELLEQIRVKLAAFDPVSKLREMAEAQGYGLVKLPK